MAYENKPGSTGNLSKGGEYDNTDEASVVSYPNLAAASAAAAANSATSAAGSATSASNSATAAAASATTVANSVTAAANSATAAASSATSAANSAATATTQATNASNSANAAVTSATSAATSASTATNQAGIATVQATNAATSATSASTSATNSANSASASAISATNSANSATAASTSATNAANSATAAAGSSTSASGFASAASTSATNAASSATAASNSATSASNFATNASNSATTATTQAGIATTQATNATTSANASATSASAAQAAADQALAAFDNFDDKYLGQKTADPTVDNDGNPLQTGALYFNTVDNIMKVYTGTVWLAAYASLSGALIANNNLSDLQNVSVARTNLGLGTAATTNSTAYATAAQGSTADSAYADRLKWDGGATSLVAATGRASLGLGTIATQDASNVTITGGTESGVTHNGDTVGTYLNYTPTSAPSFVEGRVWYDSTAKTLSYYNDASSAVVHIGQDTLFKVINNTGSTIANGAAVYITGTSSGQTYPNIALAQANVAGTSAVIGLTNGSIANGATGYVTAQGVIDNVNTSAFTTGQILYLSPYSAGQYMNTVPPTGYVVQVGTVSYVNSTSGKIFVKQITPLAVSTGILVGAVAIANGGTGQTTATASFNALAPTQTSQTGKYLKTDGTNTSWATVDALPSQTGQTGKYLTTDGTTASWNTVVTGGGPITQNATTIASNQTIASGSNGFSVGPMTVSSGYSVSIASGQRWVII